MTHIKINDVNPRIRYLGNGAQTSFVYPFAIFKPTDIEVFFDTEIQNTGYTVFGAGETEGGTVVFDTPPAAGVVITLYRNLPISRQTDFQDGGPFRAQVINDELDYQVALVQQLNEKFDRCLSVGITDEANVEDVIPSIFAARDICQNVENKAVEMITIGENLQQIVDDWETDKTQMLNNINEAISNKMNPDYSNAVFIPANKPQLISQSEAGYVMGINSSAGSAFFTLPAGGTWFCYLYNNSTSQTLTAAPCVRIVAGETTLSLTGSGYLYGFAWRIA